MSRHASTLDEIDAKAAEWVARRDAGLEPHEQAEFERWSAASVLHVEALARFEATWTAAGRPRRTGARNALTEEMSAIALRRRRRRAAIAASCIVALAVGTTWWKQRMPEPPEPRVAQSRTIVHEPARETLPDGSVVVRAAGAELTVDFSGRERRVALQRGTAHFAVAADAGRPFVVVAGGVEFRALGTAFSVQLGRNAVDVLVTEGRVSVVKAPPAGTAATAIAPAPLALVEAGSHLAIEIALQPVAVAAPTVQAVDPGQIAKQLAWLNPRVEFSDAPLAEVVTVLNRYNQVKFSFGDTELAHVLLSGLFRADDVEAFCRMLEAGFEVTVERRADEIVLRKRR